MAKRELPRPARPRPLAGLPLSEIARQAPQLAKGWLVALVAEAPLEAAARLPAARFAREAPGVCAACVLALGDDGELERTRAAASDAGAWCGAVSASEVAAAFDVLSSVLWAAVLPALPDPDAAGVAALAQRLAAVCGAVRQAAIAGLSDAATHLADADADAALHAAHIADPTEPELVPSHADRFAARRNEAQPWRAALVAGIERADLAGEPLALLLVELEDAERLAIAQPEALGRFARALRAQLRRGDLLAREDEGRCWIVAHGTGRAAARMLAERAIAEVSGEGERASVGIAIYPEDGRNPDTLMELGEQALFAAQAAGVRMSLAGDAPREP